MNDEITSERDLVMDKSPRTSTTSTTNSNSNNNSNNSNNSNNNNQTEMKPHVRVKWPRAGREKEIGDILFWPRFDQLIAYTHWAVYIGRRKPTPKGFKEHEDFPEAVAHLWGASDSKDRSMSNDAVVIYSELSEVNDAKDAPEPFCGNYRYDSFYTPMRSKQILHRAFVALEHKFYEREFGGYSVIGNNCEHFATWARYGFQHSDQVGDMFTNGLTAIGFAFMGPPGLVLGSIAGNIAQTETRKARREKNYILDEAIMKTTSYEEEDENGENREESNGNNSTHNNINNLYEKLDEEATHDYSDDKEVDWTIDCLVDYVELSNIQFSEEKHERYEKVEKYKDDNAPLRIHFRAAATNNTTTTNKNKQKNIIDVDSRGEVRFGGEARAEPENDLKELAKDLGKIGLNVCKGMFNFSVAIAQETIEAGKRRREQREKLEREALIALENVVVPTDAVNVDVAVVTDPS